MDPKPLGIVLTLGDGRRVTVADLGQDNHFPVLVFDAIGVPFLSHFGGKAAGRAHGRLLAIDRPLVSARNSASGAHLEGVASDAREVVDLLGLDEVGIVGLFSSSASALAAAALLGSQVVHVTLINPGVPDNVAGSSTPARQAILEELTATWWQAADPNGGAGPDWDEFLIRVARLLPPSDRRILKNPAVRPLVLDALRRTPDNVSVVFEEMEAAAAPWPFDLSSIRSRVMIWHSRHDTLFPITGGQYLADHLEAAVLVRVGKGGALWFIDPRDAGEGQ